MTGPIHDFEDVIVRPAAPGASAQWLPYDLGVNDPPTPNWDCVNAVEFDPSDPSTPFVLAPFGSGPGEKDLYGLEWGHPGQIAERITLKIVGGLILFGAPTPGNRLRPLIVVNGDEIAGADINMDNIAFQPVLETTFNGPFTIKSRDWLQIGMQRFAGVNTVAIVQVWAIVRLRRHLSPPPGRGL